MRKGLRLKLQMLYREPHHCPEGPPLRKGLRQKGQRELVALRFQFRHTLQAIAFQNLRLQYRDGDFSWEDALPIVETAALLGGCTYPLSRNLSTPCESEC